ncbi:MAG: haloacid dehalogenase [Reinekea sp.]
MMKKTVTATSTFILLLTLASVTATAATCPDTSATDNSPSNPIPAAKKFRHWGSRLLSFIHTPYHMVYDALVSEGANATMVGKFDYGWTSHKDLEDEEIEVYLSGTGMKDWEYLGTYTTDSDGKIYVPVSARPAGHYKVQMIVSGDMSSATGYLTVVEPGTKAVMFDIDGTLTQDDFEAIGDYLGIGIAQPYYYAPETVRAYKDKGYCITYLSARPYWLMKDTREWLDHMDIPLLHTHTDPDAEIFKSKDTAGYKTDYINSLISAGLDIIRVYGNAATDIEAYANAGIPKSETYIIGDLAGVQGTQPMNGDYSHHYSTVVVNTPNAQ